MEAEILPWLDTVISVLEYISLVVGVLVVLCLIYEKYWAWPLGVLFCLLSAPVMYFNSLYGYLTLTLFGFLPMNIYGWYFWLAGTEEKQDLPVSRASPRAFLIAGGLCVIAIFCLPYGFALIVNDYFETASYIYLDNTILVLSLCAMWFTARKFIENWFIWIVVNVGTVTLYGLTELWGLAALYALYFCMAFWGYYQWTQSMRTRKTTTN